MQATIKADKLAALLSGASVAAGKDKTLPLFNVVKLELTRDKIRLSATDRYRLAIGQFPIDLDGDPTELLIATNTVKDLISWLKPFKSSLILIEQYANGIVFNCAGMTYLVASVDQDYPDLDKIMPLNFGDVSEIYFDSEYLSDVVKVSGKGVTLKWQFTTPVRPAVATFTDKHDIEWQYLVMPIRKA